MFLQSIENAFSSHFHPPHINVFQSRPTNKAIPVAKAALLHDGGSSVTMRQGPREKVVRALRQN